MEMVKKVKEVEVFVVDDKEFLSEADANYYLTHVLGRLKNIKYYSITYNPDLTEGRGCYGRIILAIEMSYSHSLMAELFCEHSFGSRVAWVQGCSPTVNWRVNEVQQDVFMNFEKSYTSVGDYNYKAKKVFISNNDLEVEGFIKALRMPQRNNEKFANLDEYLNETNQKK